MSKIDRQHTNGFRAMKALERAASDARVEEIEGAGMDEGRVFIHLARGFWFAVDGCHSRSVGSAAELKDAMQLIAPCTCNDCTRKAE
jgi:hypothetical protein